MSYLLRNKDSEEVTTAFIEFINILNNNNNNKYIKEFNTNRGLEFNNKRIKAIYINSSIIYNIKPLYTYKLNSLVERIIYTIINKVRIMLYNLNLPLYL